MYFFFIHLQSHKYKEKKKQTLPVFLAQLNKNALAGFL